MLHLYIIIKDWLKIETHWSFKLKCGQVNLGCFPTFRRRGVLMEKVEARIKS